MLNSSGDRGAYADCSHVSVSFPASDPDWLGIGATNLELSAGPVYQSQGAWGDVGNCSGNGGGSGGGCSAKYAAPSYQSVISSFCGSSAKAVPDVSLNGDWFNSPQSVYFNGSFSGNGGTSISAPMMAGFYAQQNSYGLELGSICGSGSAACAPIGQAGQQLYLAANSHAAQGKNAFYDITSGCTTNEVGSGFCGITGYDRASGWGTPNMLQLAWANNYWNMGEASPPTITMSGPATAARTPTPARCRGRSPTTAARTRPACPATPRSGTPTRVTRPARRRRVRATRSTAGRRRRTARPAVRSSLASAGQGCHTLFVRAWDNIGESAVNSYGPVCYDNTAPVPTAPKIALTKNSTLSTAGLLPVKVTWSATDNLSGIGSYHLSESVNGGAFTPVTLANPTAKSATVKLTPGNSYQFEVAATDGAGNTSAFTTNATRTYNLYEENDASIAYSTGWTLVGNSAAVGGKSKYSTTANNKATFTFTGKQVGWVSFKSAGRGTASVKLGSAAAKNVNTHATNAVQRRLVYVSSVTGTGSKTLVVTNQATSGSPRIDVDAFVVLA